VAPSPAIHGPPLAAHTSASGYLIYEVVRGGDRRPRCQLAAFSLRRRPRTWSADAMQLEANEEAGSALADIRALQAAEREDLTGGYWTLFRPRGREEYDPRACDKAGLSSNDGRRPEGRRKNAPRAAERQIKSTAVPDPRAGRPLLKN